jgi:DNA mismatch repair ATPase MutS
MRSVGQFAELLVASKSELLRDYGRSLQQSPLYPDTPDFKRLKRALQPGLWSRILDFFLGYSRFSLQNLTERVLGRFEADYEQVLKIITDIDILQSNVMSMQDGYTIATLLEDGPPRLQIVKGHHPFLHRKSPVHSVPNDLDLEVSPSSQRRFAILTGPNAGGKSTYLRMVAGNVLLALSGNLVPAESMELTPMLVFTNMRVMDSVEDSESFFYAQAKRIKCLDEATKIHDPCLVVFDEIGTGTGSREKQALERTLIARLLARRVACLVATHEQSLAHIAENTPGMFNLRVASRDTEEYRVLPGIAVSSEAGKVLAEVGLDLDFLREYENQLAIIQGSTIQGSTIQGDSCFADG